MFYFVKIGDTLENIACQFGISARAIIISNRMKAPVYIYPGMVLYIPLHFTHVLFGQPYGKDLVNE